MLGLPIVNDQLETEAIGFREFEGHDIGVLLTPWFMNLFLLPGDDQWSQAAPGSKVEVSLPGECCEFVVNQDDELGTCLSAILFRTVTDFPDQATGRAIADEVLVQLFTTAGKTEPGGRLIDRRSFLSGLGAG